jgi:RNA methyltransferase, TrmH family
LDTLSIGKHNPRLVDIRRAVQRGALTRDGLLPVEGPKLVHEAHASGIPIEALLLREEISTEELPRASITYMLESGVFKGIQSTEHSQGVIALVRLKAWTLEEVFIHSPAPIVVLAGLQDPGNVGTILRVAESFGAAGCLALSGTAAIHNSKVVRSSAGSVFRLPCVWDLQLNTVLEALKSRKITLIGTSPHAAHSITSWDWTRPAAVLIGNEGAGLSSMESAACAEVLKIPQQPQMESLNSAIAAAVVLYEAYRRKNPS